MPERRKDPLSEIWGIYAPGRKFRPQYNKTPGEESIVSEECPFCEGNEAMTPPEVYALREKGSEADKPGWRLRVIPNKYPALGGEGEPGRGREGFYEKINGIGVHEVVIETKFHQRGVDQMEVGEVADIFLAYKNRILALKEDRRYRYIQVFKNQGGRAGATIPHPHAQVVAMPVVPARVRERLMHAEAYLKANGRCIFCDIIRHESESRERVLMENPDYIVLAPYASRLPFELEIYPREHSAAFEETDNEKLQSLAEVYKETMRRVNKALENPHYNLLLHNAPNTHSSQNLAEKTCIGCNPDEINESGAPSLLGSAFLGRGCRPHFHWHLELIPMVGGTGGFELGTYTYINPTLPEEAIEVLRTV